MKTFWKILGIGALAAGLAPYKVETDEETGEKSYQALLWRITSAPTGEEKKFEIGINLGEGTLTSKLMNAVDKKKEEPHLFSDELSVEYVANKAEEAAEEVKEAAEEATGDIKEAAEEVAETAAEIVEEAAEKVAEVVEPSEIEEPKAG